MSVNDVKYVNVDSENISISDLVDWLDDILQQIFPKDIACKFILCGIIRRQYNQLALSLLISATCF